MHRMVKSSRRGRRPGAPDTRSAILTAAREEFAAHGFVSTTIRQVAASAEVDPALVHHYFGTKDDLFIASLELNVDPRVVLEPVIAGGVDGVGERLLGALLSVWEDEETRLPLLAVMRGIGSPAGQTLVRDSARQMVIAPVLDALAVDRPDVRAGLVSAQLIGLVVSRYLLDVEPVASLPVDELIALFAPNIQRCFDVPLP